MPGTDRGGHSGACTGIGKKLREAGRWLAEKPDCDDCRDLLALYGKTPDCEACAPKIMDANRRAWDVFGMCGDQAVMGPGGPVGINLAVVLDVCDRLQLPDAMDCAMRCKTLFAAVVEAMQNKKG